MGLLTALGSTQSFLQLLNVLIIFVIVLGITYFVTRWIAGYQKSQMLNKNMKVVETMRISNNKYIQIVSVGERYLVLAICKDTITLIAELEGDELVEGIDSDIKMPTKESFEQILEKVKKYIPKK